jgi:hypothetical protein
MSWKANLLLWKHPIDTGTVLVLDGNDNGREIIESIQSNDLRDYPDDGTAYQSLEAGMGVLELEYEDETLDNLLDSSVRSLNQAELKRLENQQDVLMNV